MGNGFGRVAKALAIGIGAGMEGYGKGTLQVALNARDEYQQRLKAERDAALSAEERGWKSEETEKERAHDFELLEKKQELEMAGQERSLQNQITLAKMRGSGGGGGGGGSKAASRESAYLKRARELEELQAKVEGREPSEAGVLKQLEKIGAGRSATTSGTGKVSESAYLKRAREQEELDAQAEGRPVDMKNIARNFKELSTRPSRTDTSEGMTPAQKLSAINAEIERLNNPITGGREMRGKSAEEIEQIAIGNVNRRISRLGGDDSGLSTQESVAEAPQPQKIEAPATSPQGEKPTRATPKGEGSERSPYLPTSQEQLDWFLEFAPPGSYIVIDGKLKRKPEK